MNTVRSFPWAKCKQEFFSIAAVSASQIWWNFHFPPLLRFGYPYNALAAGVLSVGTTVLYTLVFSYANTYFRYFETSVVIRGKPIRFTWGQVASFVYFNIMMIFALYYDWYHMSVGYYVLFYAHYILFYALLYRAMYR